MSSSSGERDPVDILAEKFVERYRAGERPALTEYTEQYPQWAAEIRELFPALLMMEQLKPATGDGTGALGPPAGGPPLERVGDFRILREIGRGGMGIVYEAEQISLGRHVALKILPSHALLQPRQIERFQREARAAARLHHTNIVPVYGVGEQGGLHYYVMQYIQGQSLDAVLGELKRLRAQARIPPSRAASSPAGPDSAEGVARALLTGRFHVPLTPDESGEAAVSPGSVAVATVAPQSKSSSDTLGSMSLLGHSDTVALTDSSRPYWEAVAQLGIQVGEALAYAHGQGTLHRDIKPSNLLLDTQGRVWVTDFGLAKAGDQDNLTHPGDIVGTLRYLAPERFSGHADSRSDIYSLGLTLYEMVALQPAFDETDRNKLLAQVAHAEPTPPRALNASIPRDLETIVLKAIARDRGQRYATAVELVEDLKRFVEDRPIQARPVTRRERFWRWCRRNPWVASLSAAVILTMVTGTVVSTYFAFQSRIHAAKVEEKAEQIRIGMERLNQANACAERARLNEDRNRWADAVKELNEAVELRPDYSMVWGERGNLYLRLGLWEEAASDIAEQFKLQAPADPMLWFRHACLRVHAGDEEGYRQVCAEMWRRFHDTREAEVATWVILACTLTPNSGLNPTEVVDFADRLLGSPHDPHATLRAAAYYRAGRYDKAAKVLAQARNVPGEDHVLPRTRIVSALVHWRLQQKKEATEFLAKAAEQLKSSPAPLYLPQSYMFDPTSGPLPTTLLQEHLAAARSWGYTRDLSSMELLDLSLLYKEAAGHLHSAAQADLAQFWASRARGYLALGQNDEATKTFKRALQLAPGDATLWLERARLHARLGAWKEADADYDRAVELQPDRIDLWAERFALYFQRNRLDDAAKTFVKTIELIPEDQKSARLQVYQVLLLSDDLLDRVSRLRPNDFDLHFSLAEQHGPLAQKRGRKSNWARAASLYSRAIDLKPNDPALHSARGQAYDWSGARKQALADFDRAIELQPDDPRMYVARAESFGYHGDFEKAGADLAHALRLRPDTDNGMTWQYHAVVCAYLKDTPGYLKACEDVARVLEPSERDEAIRLVPMVCVLAPGALGDPERVLRLARRRMERSQTASLWNHHVLGLALYRAGHHQEAIDVVARRLNVDAQFSIHGSNLMLLAMAHYKLGHTEEARDHLQKGLEWADERVKNKREEGRYAPTQIDWWDWLKFQLLQREARELMKIDES
jgi:serine/threonine protein kinase/Flp pilus assembly protein TadD